MKINAGLFDANARSVTEIMAERCGINPERVKSDPVSSLLREAIAAQQHSRRNDLSLGL